MDGKQQKRPAAFPCPEIHSRQRPGFEVEPPVGGVREPLLRRVRFPAINHVVPQFEDQRVRDLMAEFTVEEYERRPQCGMPRSESGNRTTHGGYVDVQRQSHASCQVESTTDFTELVEKPQPALTV